MNKKLIITLLLFVITLAAGTSAYFLSRKTEMAADVAPNQSPQPSVSNVRKIGEGHIYPDFHTTLAMSNNWIAWISMPPAQGVSDTDTFYNLQTGQLHSIGNIGQSSRLEDIYENKILASTMTPNRDKDMLFVQNTESGEIINIIPNKGTHHGLIYKNKVVYTEYIDQVTNYLVILYDIETQKSVQIATNASNLLSINGDYIAWQSQDKKIMLHNYSDGTTTTLFESAGIDSYPAVNGNGVVWIGNQNGQTSLYHYSINTKKITTIQSSMGDAIHPDIYGDNIVWSESRDGMSQLYLYNMVTGQKQSIFSTASNIDAGVAGILTKAVFRPRIDNYHISWIAATVKGRPIEVYLAELVYPKTASPSPKLTPKPTPKPAPKSTPTNLAKPTLSLSSLTRLTGGSASSKTTTISITSNPILRKDQTYTLSGTTSPNAKITLTIQSDPITKEVTANEKGEWTYTLNPKELKLPIGEHTVTAYATDTAGVVSDPQELLKFTLKNPLGKPDTIQEPYNYFSYMNIISAIIILVGIGFLIFRIIKKPKLTTGGIGEQ